AFGVLAGPAMADLDGRPVRVVELRARALEISPVLPPPAFPLDFAGASEPLQRSVDARARVLRRRGERVGREPDETQRERGETRGGAAPGGGDSTGEAASRRRPRDRALTSAMCD